MTVASHAAEPSFAQAGHFIIVQRARQASAPMMAFLDAMPLPAVFEQAGDMMRELFRALFFALAFQRCAGHHSIPPQDVSPAWSCRRRRQPAEALASRQRNTTFQMDFAAFYRRAAISPCTTHPRDTTIRRRKPLETPGASLPVSS